LYDHTDIGDLSFFGCLYPVYPDAPASMMKHWTLCGVGNCARYLVLLSTVAVSRCALCSCNNLPPKFAKSRIILLKEVNTEVLLTIRLETDVPCLDATRVTRSHVSLLSPGFRATPRNIMNLQVLLGHERSSLFETRRLDWIQQFSQIQILPPGSVFERKLGRRMDILWCLSPC